MQQEKLAKPCEGCWLSEFNWNRLDFPQAASLRRWCWYLLHLSCLYQGSSPWVRSTCEWNDQQSNYSITWSWASAITNCFYLDFQFKLKHFKKCLGMSFRHLIVRLEKSVCWGWSPLAVYLTSPYPGGGRWNFGYGNYSCYAVGVTIRHAGESQ